MRMERLSKIFILIILATFFFGCQSENGNTLSKTKQIGCNKEDRILSPDQLVYEYDAQCKPLTDSHGNYIFKQDRAFMIGDNAALKNNGTPMTQAEGEKIYEIGEDGYAKLDQEGNPILKSFLY